MANKVQPIPEGYHALTPHLTVRDAAKAIEFYRRAFGAVERGQPHLGPDGKTIMHAELTIGDSILMLNDEFPEMGCFSPLSKPGDGVCIHLYVEDVDTVFRRAVEAGSTEIFPLQDAFWGDRYGKLKDPFGHAWSLATRKENVTLEEIKRRAEAAFSSAGGCA